jgi:hypothetical protein
MHPIRFIVCLCFLLLSSEIVLGEGLEVRHSAGAQSRTLALRGDYWFQALGEQLIVLKKNSGDQVASVQLTMPACGICTDLLAVGDTLFALLDGEEVIELDISSPQSLNIVSRKRADEIGIRPRQFATIGDIPVVMGDGGVVRLVDGSPVVECDDEVTGVFNTLHNGEVYALNRRLYSADTHTFLGSATEVHPLSDSANAPSGTLVFVRALEGKTEVGLMTSELKEIGSLGKVVIEGAFTDVLLRGSRVFLVTNKGIYVLGVSPKELRLLRKFPVNGVRSIGIVASNYFALCGDFGYGLYRIEDDPGGVGRTLFRVVPANGAMKPGFSTGRNIEVQAENGSFYYSFGGDFSPCYSDHASQMMRSVHVPTSAIVLGAEAEIEEDGSVTMRTSEGDMQVTLPSPAITVVAVAGDFWFGTKNGIYIIGHREDEPLLCGLQLAGPIVQLIPLLDGTVGFVSGAGVVGVVANN